MEVRDLSINAADPDAAREALAAIAARDALALVAAANGEGKAVPDPVAVLSATDPPPAGPVPDPAPDVRYREVFGIQSVRLLYPFSIDGIEVSSVTLLPPTFGDVEAVTTGKISELEMHARMCGLPVAALRAMRWSDTEMVTLLARHLAPEIQRR